jgi:hypothetical protein
MHCKKDTESEQNKVRNVPIKYIKNRFMWTESHSIITKETTKEQMWKLFTDINNWHVWNNEIEFAKLEGKFEAGNHYLIQQKKRKNS